ncbi:DUF934 domain-containing protein [Ideonella sp. DXS29W]|uniref:DUF934 domain-containing protein n=1 Tax=Ideonella lacteola TaxID=2984193 RepID=A0ABU9BUN5_9BURK
MSARTDMKFVQAANDPWRASVGEYGPLPIPPVAAHSLLTLEQWQAVRSDWPEGLPVGITLANTVDVETLADDLPRFALVALQFPKWIDGRAYSQARVLRARLRFAGEVRATGDVVVDMLPLLQRTGFDAVQLRDGQSEESARRALSIVTEHYQGDVHETRPLFSRVPA